LNVSAQADGPEKFGVVASSLPKGLEVGSKAPLFKAKDKEGNTFKLKKALKNGPVVLIFFRGYWCPACAQYLGQYADSLKMVAEKGVQLVTVTPESYKHMKKYEEKTKDHTFTVISDTKESVMKAYGVRFEVTKKYDAMLTKYLKEELTSINENDQSTLPVPATYIIDKEGKIVWKQFDINYKNRANVKDIIANLP